jgi:hypothetical protein
MAEQVREMGQWINDLAAQHREVARRLAERQSLTIPAEDTGSADIGPAFPAWTGTRTDAIPQPLKPEIPAVPVDPRPRHGPGPGHGGRELTATRLPHDLCGDQRSGLGIPGPRRCHEGSPAVRRDDNSSLA